MLRSELPGCAHRLRIFNPTTEMEFAGHPTIGAAHVLAALDAIPLRGGQADVLLEEPVGPVPVSVWGEQGRPARARLRVAQLAGGDAGAGRRGARRDAVAHDRRSGRRRQMAGRRVVRHAVRDRAGALVGRGGARPGERRAVRRDARWLS